MESTVSISISGLPPELKVSVSRNLFPTHQAEEASIRRDGDSVMVEGEKGEENRSKT